MRSFIVPLACLVLIAGCAAAKPAPAPRANVVLPADAVPATLPLASPPNLPPPAKTADADQPPSSAETSGDRPEDKPAAPAQKQYRINFPNQWWTLLPPDQVPQGFKAFAVHQITKAAIGFALASGEVKEIAEGFHTELAKFPELKISAITCSPDGNVASFTFDVWSTGDKPEVQESAKFMVRLLPTRPETPILAIGTWNPRFNKVMTLEFDATIMDITYE